MSALTKRFNKILVVEDSLVLQRIYARALSRLEGEGTQLVQAGYAFQAFKRLHENPDTDLILLDTTLPDMSGMDVLRRLKQDPVLRGVPVIIVSAEAGKEDIQLGMGAGAAGYLPKPFRLDDLFELIERTSIERPKPNVAHG
jgi:two-component system chemotaxis response regulator CheY